MWQSIPVSNHAFQVELNKAYAAYGECKLVEKEYDELNHLLLICTRHAAAYPTDPDIKPVIAALRLELNERQQTKRHKEVISEQQRLHNEQIAAAESLQEKSSTEESGRHRKTQFWVRLATLISFAALAVAWLAYCHDLQNTPPKTELPLPLLLTPSAREITPQVLINAVQTNSVSATNQARPATTNQDSP